MAEVLFVLKRRENVAHNPISTGLYNSAKFVHDMLCKNGIDSEIAVVIDNNGIDREVARCRPRIVVIEALWVVPEKFAVLQRLHPKVQWIIRTHSDIPFMSGEGSAIDWILDCVHFDNVRVAPNSPKMLADIETLCVGKYGTLNKNIIYLPNYYPTEMRRPKGINYDKPWVDISCFGAIRPLKNQLIQAVAAIDFVQKVGNKRLKFHMNIGRIESNGSSVDHNLRGLFQQLDPRRYELIFHAWCNHKDFIRIASGMDIAMQISFSETFNIVGADHVMQGVAFLGSDEIPWYTQGPVELNNSGEIRDHLLNIYENPILNTKVNQYDLTKYVEESERIWLKFIKGDRSSAIISSTTAH